MIRALKVALIAYGVLGILWGLAFIFIPRQLGVSQGYESWPKYSAFFLAVLGTYNIAPSVFLITAARDPIRHVSWV
ncbi:MAG: hypothetical protein NTV30_05350, partial [Chloroflexi bacterium]|nr:hypothetical protein [Chloroflexota bacterium]